MPELILAISPASSLGIGVLQREQFWCANERRIVLVEISTEAQKVSTPI
jgi:hypothetical protein